MWYRCYILRNLNFEVIMEGSGGWEGVKGSEGRQALEVEEKRVGILDAWGKRWKWILVDGRSGCWNGGDWPAVADTAEDVMGGKLVWITWDQCMEDMAQVCSVQNRMVGVK